MTTAAPVLVVGAGPAGSATAMLLARRGADVLIVDQGDFTAFRPGETLPPLVRRHLERWNLWDAFVSLAPNACFTIQAIWDRPRARTVEHLANPYGCAWHVDRRRFDRVIFDAAIQAGAVGRLRTRLESVTPSDGGWTAILYGHGEHTTTTASFIVDATGRRGAVARQLGTRRRTTDDRIALSATVAGVCDDVLLVEAAAHGWWSSAGVHSTISVSYVTSANTLRHERRRMDDVLREELLQVPRTKSRLASARPACLHVTVAGSSCLDSVAGPRWVAVGDAACTFDPISGLGVVKAFDDAERAVNVISQHLGRGRDEAATYNDRIQRRFVAYRRDRDCQYHAVDRWPDSAFWSE